MDSMIITYSYKVKDNFLRNSYVLYKNINVIAMIVMKHMVKSKYI